MNLFAAGTTVEFSVELFAINKLSFINFKIDKQIENQIKD